MVLRLIKTAWSEPLPAGTKLALIDGRGNVLDREIIHPDHGFPMTFGFWIPPAALRRSLSVQVTRPDGANETHAVTLERSGECESLPLAPIADLHAYLLRREQVSDLWPGVERFDVARYLGRHAIVYEKPVEHWTDGLYLGNGIVGGIVTGHKRGELRLGLDHARIWPTDHQDRPIGRCYAADVVLRYDAGDESFNQVLDIGQGEIRTRQSDLTITCRINRETSVAHIDLTSERSQRIEVSLSRRELVLLSEGLPAVANGSWIRALPHDVLERNRQRVADAPRAPINVRGNTLICRAPNQSIVATIRCSDATATASSERELKFTFDLSARSTRTISIAIDVCDESAEERTIHQQTQRLVQPSSLKTHRESWQRFWNRSFIQLHDPLQEALYYHGLYHLACAFAGNDAASFFGMTQPIDHRTWRDAHVTDAQTQMLQWGTLATNHLATAAPLLKSYADAWIEHAEHTPGRGTKVPHMFYPAEGGGHASLAPPAKIPYPFGSTAWHALDFWWDFLYSGDQEFLRSVAYPILRSAAEAIVSTMTLGADGHYHCLDSNSPEQDNCRDDNVYDRVCVQALLEAVIRASEILNVDADERRQLTDVLAKLFPLASDEQTLFECPTNHHPYRCHPVVLMGLYPLALWQPGTREHALANRTFDIVTNVYAFHYEDRHRTIPGHVGGIEPNGHATAFLLGVAARLRRRKDFDRLFRCLVVGRQLKRNGLRAICDPRHTVELERMGIIEASSGQTAAISELFVQSWGAGRVDVFACATRGDPQRFAGLRAAGGFVLSGEWTGEQVRFVAVHSFAGGELLLNAPWESGTTVWSKRLKGDVSGAVEKASSPLRLSAGETIVLSCVREDLQPHLWDMPDAPPSRPILIPVTETDPHTPDVLYYPEDLPHGQDLTNGYLALGNPAKVDAPAAHVWSESDALDHVRSNDKRLRQTAARVLGRHVTATSRDALTKLARDADVLVAATAVVSLVRHDDRASDEALSALLPELPAYVRNESDKATRRREIMKNLETNTGRTSRHAGH